MELTELIEKLNKGFDEYKAANDARLDAIAKGLNDPLNEDKLKKLDGHLDTLTKQIEDINARMNRGPRGAEGSDKEALKRDAFLNVLRNGEAGLSAEYKNVLTRSDDTTGGYLAPTEVLKEILKTVAEFSPARDIVRVRKTGQRSVMIPKKTGNLSAVWVGETQPRTETEGLGWGMEEIPTHELTAEVYISLLDLEDSAYDLEAEIRAEFGEQFGVAEGAAVINGNGVKKPEGLLVAAGVDEVKSGAAAAVTADGLINLYYGVKTAYASRGRWLLNRSTLGSIRKLKDQQNQYLWQPGLAAGQPNTILNAPYTETPDMPDEAAGTFPVAFGDFKRGYIMVDRLALAVMRDPFTRASLGQIKFVARRRVGGQTVMTEAFKKLKCSV